MKQKWDPTVHNAFEAYGHLMIYHRFLFMSLNMPLQQNPSFGTYFKITLGTLEVPQKQMALDLCEASNIFICHLFTSICVTQSNYLNNTVN